MSIDRHGSREGTGRTSALVDAPERRRAVRDFSQSLCVEAGAGTGKTKLLVDRFLEIVRTGRARCTQVVAITFTEKAAGEMKMRLRDEIEALLGEEAIPEDERERLAAARDDLERAPISTIHSFASAVLREHPIEAGIDPSFVQLDALEDALLIEECWEAFLEQISPPFDSLLRRIMSLGVGIDRVRDVALSMYERRGERYVAGVPGMERSSDGGNSTDPGGEPWHRGEPGHNGAGDRSEEEDPVSADILDDFSGLDAVRDTLVARVDSLMALADAHCVNEDDSGYRVIRDLGGELAGIEDLGGAELEDFLLSISFPKLNAGNKDNWHPADACAEQKQLVRAVREMLEEYRCRVADRVRDALWIWLMAFSDFVDARKAADGVLDFDDLLIRTRVLLRDEAARLTLKHRYRYILVDEFQDTDPLQAEIILLLAGPQSVAGDDAIEPGKLFVVGDPKQSIYRFRKADVEIYEEVKELLVRTGSHLKIVQNFRSVPGITGWVNRTFAAIIRKPETGRFQPAYESIHPHRTGGGPAVIQLDLEMPSADAKIDEVRRREGEAIARTIRRLVSEGRMVGDAERGTVHPLRYGDIAVLYPGTTGIDYYEDPIRVEEIPFIVEGGKLYYTRQEVRDLAAALWCVEDPYDSLSLVATLRSPLFGFSDEEIFLYVRSGGRLHYLEEMPSRDGRFADLAEAFDLLADLHRRRNERGPVRTVTLLLCRTGYRELSLLRPHGEQRVLNIGKAVEIAREFDGGRYSYRRFAEWFRQQESLGAVEGESPLVDESEDAVRLITIHKSKGLQFPVVILANLVQRRTRSSTVLLERGSHLAFKLGNMLETSDFESLKEREMERDEAEVARLLYVAATRAGDILVVPRTARRGSYFELVEPHLPGTENGGLDGGDATAGIKALSERDAVGDELIREGIAEDVESAGVVTWRVSELPPLRGTSKPFVRIPRWDERKRARAIRRKNEWLNARNELIERSVLCPVVVTPSAAERGEADGTIDAGVDLERGGAERGTPSTLAAGASSEAERGRRFGSAFHRLMELVDLSGTGDVPALAAAVASEHGITGVAAELETLARRTIAAAPLRNASRAGRLFREVPFTLSLSVPGLADNVPTNHFLEGRVDLLFEQDGVWTALDYKTDTVSAGDVDMRFHAYRTQGILYAVALERLGIALGGGVLFYFVRPDRIRRLTVDGDLLKEGEELISRVINARFT